MATNSLARRTESQKRSVAPVLVAIEPGDLGPAASLVSAGVQKSAARSRTASEKVRRAELAAGHRASAAGTPPAWPGGTQNPGHEQGDRFPKARLFDRKEILPLVQAPSRCIVVQRTWEARMPEQVCRTGHRVCEFARRRCPRREKCFPHSLSALAVVSCPGSWRGICSLGCPRSFPFHRDPRSRHAGGKHGYRRERPSNS